MKKIVTLLSLVLFTLSLQAQNAVIRGQLQDTDGNAAIFSNVILYNAADSSIYKVETSNDAGIFQIRGIDAGNYYLEATMVGMSNLRKSAIQLQENEQKDLGVLVFQPAAVELEAATVTASRAMVEIKPDRTVFNVEGTINSTGDDALTLLRKAPSVMIDNNDNINVLGRAGVLLYVDGKRLPLTGEDLSNYLQNLPADQIDRIEIITNPGARYEAEGNAGIIDIRLKKDKNLGANGSVTGTFSQGRFGKGNANTSGNYRNKMMNVFATAGYNGGNSFHDMEFFSRQNGLILDETNEQQDEWQGYNYRIGTDFFLNNKNTIGFLVGGFANTGTNTGINRIDITTQANPNFIDSILVAGSDNQNERTQNTFNINYRFDNSKGRTLNIDADYGRFRAESLRDQPNRYFDATEEQLLTEVINSFDTPTDIDIYTFKVDFEEKLLGGKLGLGSKLSRVVTDNTFLFYDVVNGELQQNNFQSNRFNYTENVYAGYINFARPLGEKWSFSAGLRAEQTDAVGDLTAFRAELQEDPVELNYLSWFPSAGLTWQLAPKHNLALNYGRRINRPDYQVLNPFNNQLSELSYEKGNPFLRPEIVNNVELGYTLAYRYNFKVAYSRTIDQITRLIAPDDEDPRAGFITWDNLAQQTIYSANISAPVQFAKGWNAYFNAGASYIDNQADYGDGAVVDVQAFTYNIYQQHTFKLPWEADRRDLGMVRWSRRLGRRF
jgi:iron complex outermembrane receptor protein